MKIFNSYKPLPKALRLQSSGEREMNSQPAKRHTRTQLLSVIFAYCVFYRTATVCFLVVDCFLCRHGRRSSFRRINSLTSRLGKPLPKTFQSTSYFSPLLCIEQVDLLEKDTKQHVFHNNSTIKLVSTHLREVQDRFWGTDFEKRT